MNIELPIIEVDSMQDPYAEAAKHTEALVINNDTDQAVLNFHGTLVYLTYDAVVAIKAKLKTADMPVMAPYTGGLSAVANSLSIDELIRLKGVFSVEEILSLKDGGLI